MFRTVSLAIIAAATLSLTAPLYAADEKKPDNDSAEARHAALFDKLDVNHDGFITADEVPAEHRRLFDRLLHNADKNGDGKLSREEFIAGMAEDKAKDRPEGGPGAGPGPGRMMGPLFNALDLNGDGKLDAKEIAAASESLKKIANKDGEITRDDLMKAAKESMGNALAAGGPGGAGRPDFDPDTAAKRLIQRFDKNGDGKLQKDELPERFWKHFDEMDTNHDGALDEAEVKAAIPGIMRRLAETREDGTAKRQRPGPPDDKKPDDKNTENK